MKKIFYTLLFIPLVIYSQEVFSASFSYGNQSYTTAAPSSKFLKQNNQNLMNDACEYDKQLQSEMKKLERCKEENWLDKIYQNNTRQNLPSQNGERQTETPSWWRWENSYEGLGFD